MSKEEIAEAILQSHQYMSNLISSEPRALYFPYVLTSAEIQRTNHAKSRTSHLACVGFMDGSVELVDLNLLSTIPIKFEHSEEEVLLPQHDSRTTAVCFRHYLSKIEEVLGGLRGAGSSSQSQKLLIITGSSTGQLTMW